MRILLTNDDGVHARGIHILKKALDRIADVWLVAPMDEMSATGHSLTIHKPLRLIELGKQIYGVNGSPADCVYLGRRHFFKRKASLDWVVSGINRGANLGQDIYYSGTVSGAREASTEGISGLAVSLAIDFAKKVHDLKANYGAAASIAVRLLKKMKGITMPEHTILNLNVPDLPLARVKGVRLASQGFRYYDGDVLTRNDHRGRKYYWIGGKYKGFRQEDGTDCMAVDSHYASVTPIRLDATDYGFLGNLEARWPTRKVR
ncbi:MAG: 5'/3'-nucleotidase SurE [Bdellovibrionota bacterium]